MTTLSRFKRYYKAYFFPVLLLLAIVAGGLTGYFAHDKAIYLKPIGDIFLNLILTAVVPLIFFSVASSVARLGGSTAFVRILSSMFFIFILTSSIAAIFMIVVVKFFPPAQDIVLQLPTLINPPNQNSADQWVSMFSVSDFSKLWSHQNMLALILFSILVGLATSLIKEKGHSFAQFLHSGAEVFIRLVSLIMLFAPIGFFAYFASLIGELGPKLLTNYFRVAVIYYSAGIFYFIVIYTLLAFFAGKNAIRNFWQHVLIPALTALATCSSSASIPANLEATRKMGVPTDIGETVIPLGTVLHKDGSVLGAIVKISFLFGLFHMDFTGTSVLLMALIIALLVGTVMGAIPSGGMLGEMLILTLYGFSPQALLIIAAISIIIDPLATLLNVTGNTLSSMLVTRWVVGKDWVTKNPTQPLISA